MSKSFNLLLLGETGVGKSTFINSFGNYMKYQTVGAAQKGGLLQVVPTKFTVVDDRSNEIKAVKVGLDPNETFVEGQSQTQFCKTYLFSKGGNIIRLIDTPGIGDTRGIDQDKKNSENILAFIAHYPVLHGVLILLKPNHSRLTCSFRFCVKEILCHLHKSASDNIVFVFTNSRGTCFRMGDTMVTLRELLKEINDANPEIDIPLTSNRTYYVDNEGFRFMAAANQGITFSETDIKDYMKSWDISHSTCNRLMEYIAGLNPHLTAETVSINEARRMIIVFTKPLADIAQLILLNISMVEEQMKKLDSGLENQETLAKELYVPKVVIETIPCEMPITVCTAPCCVKITTDDDVAFVEYAQKCHDPCYLRNVKAMTVNNEEIRECEAMDIQTAEETCFHCKCTWQRHMHIYFTTKQTVTRKRDDRFSEKLETSEHVERTRQIINDIQERTRLLEMEKKEITKISAIFASFLQNNALAPYNDAVQEYMSHQIETEKKKIELGLSKHQVLRQLIDMLRAYQEEKAILLKELKNAESGYQNINPNEIREYTQDLFNLPIHGPILKKMVLELEDATRKEQENFSETFVY